MAILQSTTISGSNANTGSLQVTGSTVIFPIIESSLTSSFSGSGKMWINADTQNLQYTLQSSLGTVNSPARFLGAFSVGGTLITGRYLAGAFGKTQNASAVAGGADGSGSPYSTNKTEEYNGSSWSAGGNLSTARYAMCGAGTPSAGLAFGGSVGGTKQNATEEYNGASWASGGNLIVSRCTLGGAGFQDSAIAAGARYPSILSCTEEYNG